MPSINRVSAVIGTAGHVDHGKTSLVKALTGIDADRLAEEKKRGVTIDIGFAHIDFDGPSGKVRAAIIDVPGHERFIRNMLAGTTGIDMALFVVAADDGVMPQTVEHLDIMHLLGVKRGVFVITKSDLVEPSRIDEVREELTALIDKTTLAGSPIVAASASTGEGIEELKRLLIERLVREERDPGGYFRLPVDRAFALKGFGTVVTGTVASGKAAKGDEIVCYPEGYAVKIRGIQSLYLERESVASGERAALNISGVGHADIKRGSVLVSPDLNPFVEAAALKGPWYIDAFFEFLTGPPVKSRSRCKVYHLTSDSLATIQFFGAKEAAKGDKVFGRLILDKPLLMLKGDRFILRDPSVNSTIGGGVVYLPYLSKGLMRGPKKVSQGVAESDSTEEVLLKVLPESTLGFREKSISLMLNAGSEELFKALSGSKAFRVIGDHVVNLKNSSRVKRRAVEVIREYHLKNPSEVGIKEDAILKTLSNEVRGGADDGVILKGLLDGLVAEKTLCRDASTLSLAGHRVEASGADKRVEEAILKLFSDGFRAPLLEEIRALPFPASDVDRMISYLHRTGEIVKLKENVFISKGSLELARARLTDHIRARGDIKASEFRDLIGCGRKLAIEVLEYFDKERVTLRKGDLRILR